MKTESVSTYTYSANDNFEELLYTATKEAIANGDYKGAAQLANCLVMLRMNDKCSETSEVSIPINIGNKRVEEIIMGASKLEKERKIEQVLSLSEKVSDYLQKNFHPHTTVIIEVDGIRVEENLASRPIEYAVD